MLRCIIMNVRYSFRRDLTVLIITQQKTIIKLCIQDTGSFIVFIVKPVLQFTKLSHKMTEIPHYLSYIPLILHLSHIHLLYNKTIETDTMLIE